MGMGSDAFWSSTSVADAGGQHYWWFTMEIDGVNVATVGPAIDYMNMYMGYSVRCIKDQ